MSIKSSITGSSSITAKINKDDTIKAESLFVSQSLASLNLDNVTTVNMGTVTIESGATLEFADGNSINVEGIRNVGGTVVST